jgi:twitching motility protein PilT
MDIDRLLQLAIDRSASDLHLSGGNPPIVRVHGEMQPLDLPVLVGAEIEVALHSLLDEEQRTAFQGELELDFATLHRSGTRFRVNGFTNRGGCAAVFRAIPAAVPNLGQLAAPAVLERIAGLTKGLVLVTGPTGSGKSTTLAAMIDHINGTAKRHILTIEDPIEFVHGSRRSLINQREVGRDTRSFARALKSALRADPDVILVGEMRDRETIHLALTAAETGHLVLGTLHTSSAAKTIDRLIDVMPAGDKSMVRTMLSGSLQAVIAQTLLRRADGSGRVAAYEILISTPAIANLIRENQVAQINSMIQTGSRFGMALMSDVVQELTERGQVEPGEARRVLSELADDPEDGAISTGAPARRAIGAAPTLAPATAGTGYGF